MITLHSHSTQYSPHSHTYISYLLIQRPQHKWTPVNKCQDLNEGIVIQGVVQVYLIYSTTTEAHELSKKKKKKLQL